MPHSIRFQAILGIVCASMTIGLPCANAVPQSATPNIVVILADDFGWGSCACYGAKELPTPNIDRLAREIALVGLGCLFVIQATRRWRSDAQ